MLEHTNMKERNYDKNNKNGTNISSNRGSHCNRVIVCKVFSIV
jgi:hypothetical protein